MYSILIKGLVLLLSLTSLIWSQTNPWPNEPAGSQLISDFGFESDRGNGWVPVYPGGSPIRTDQNAPFSSPSVMEAGRLPGTPYGYTCKPVLTLGGRSEVYIGYWVKFSNPFEGQPHLQTKISNILWEGGSSGYGGWQWCYMWGAARGGPWVWGFQLEFQADNSHLGNGRGDVGGTWNLYPNMGDGTIALGQWHRFEYYSKASTSRTSRDGVLRWWMDGKLLGSYTNVNYPTNTAAETQFAQSWDSYDPTQTMPYYDWFDHVHVSQPNGAPPIVVITTAGIAPGQSGKPYAATLQASGGKAPYSWTLASGSLPPGLSLNKITGVISGIPTVSGRSDFAVKAMDSNVPALETTKLFSIIISQNSSSAIYLIPQREMQEPVNHARAFDIMGRSWQQNEKSTMVGTGVYFSGLAQRNQEGTIRFNKLK